MKGCFDDLIKKAQSLEDLGNLIKNAENEHDHSLECFKDIDEGKWFECWGNIYLKGIGGIMAFKDGEINCTSIPPGTLVRPIDVNIRKVVPGEFSVELDTANTDSVCELLACSNPDCDPYYYNWTLTATPKQA